MATDRRGVLQHFFHQSQSIGLVLLACTFFSLALTQLGTWGNAYTHFWQWGPGQPGQHGFEWQFLHLPNRILDWINDFAMAGFFFLAGMEVKRELTMGELSSLNKSILPLGAALGGMVVPAVLYMQFVRGTAYTSGWAIPMATDIAFTLGIMSILGKKVPHSLKVFVTALAIIDDLGAILVIALFFGSSLSLPYLLMAGAIFGAIYVYNRYRAQPGFLFWVLGILLWYAIYNSGIHATVAGVLLAWMVPQKFLRHYEALWHLPIYFLVVPLFALANTNVVVPAQFWSQLNSAFSWGITVGLVVGKPLGICLAVWLLVSRKWAVLPQGVSREHILGAGILAGIGFTMSIFMANLAFTAKTDLDTAKMAILLASLVAMLAGYLWLSNCTPKEKRP